MGFNNLIAWYSNVGRDGSQWNYLVDRINALIGPVLVWIIAITVSLNILLNLNMIPDFLTTFEDGVISSVEFSLWPLWLVSIYLVMVMFAPFTIYIHKKYPYLSMTIFIILIILIDSLNFPINLTYIKVFNYLFFWLTIHQIGYFYADGKGLGIYKCITRVAYYGALGGGLGKGFPKIYVPTETLPYSNTGVFDRTTNGLWGTYYLEIDAPADCLNLN